MPSTKYTRIEVTREAYKALEAEAILQEKTLKRLASELIMKGISKEAFDFVQRATDPGEVGIEHNSEKMEKVVKEIGTTGINIDKALLANIQRVLLQGGYSGAMLHVVQYTASAQRDELHRVLTICERYGLTPSLAADVIKNLNRIESSMK